MSRFIAGWRLPIRLALRDLRKYKGRSALAALLIFAPVLAMAGLLTFARTVDISPSEARHQALASAQALVSFHDDDQSKPLPSAGRVVGETKPPSAAQVSAQAHAPVVEQREAALMVSDVRKNAQFSPETIGWLGADLRNPLFKGTFHLTSGRLPQAPDEVAVTKVGQLSNLPTSGTVLLSHQDGSRAQTVHIVGSLTGVFQGSDLVGLAQLDANAGANTSFLIGGTHHWTKRDAAQWQSYGAEVATPDFTSRPPEPMDPDTPVYVAILTMAFIAITALLAGPAFATSATRSRRTLGLIAANGATRSVMRRVILVQALLLGLMTAVLSCVIGAVIGNAVGKWFRLIKDGTPAPIDTPVSWLVGLVAVAGISSLVAAWVPARAAGRTNLLQALRGQVSPRKVHRRMPLIGVTGVLVGTFCLYQATSGQGNDKLATHRTIWVYLGLPAFFGGAVLALPYILAATHRLAGFLPVTPRLAVRDVSRQRTRATASVGAVMATVSVFTALAIFGHSADANERATYKGSAPAGAASYGIQDLDGSVLHDTAETRAAITRIQKLAGAAAAEWIAVTPTGSPAFTARSCKIGQDASDPTSAATIVGLDPAALKSLKLNAAQRSTIDGGGALVVTSAPYWGSAMGFGNEVNTGQIKDGILPLVSRDIKNTSSAQKVTRCTPMPIKATTISEGSLLQLPGVVPGEVLVSKKILDAHHAPLQLGSIAVVPHTRLTSTQLKQLSAATPAHMRFVAEKGYQSPLIKLLLGLTLGVAVIALLTTVVSTLLNEAESQADSATLAVVGAPASMRRRVVGAHAFSISFIGAAVGMAIGTLPGLVLAHAFIAGGRATYSAPWLAFATVLFGIPLIGALITMVFTRTRPVLTRREV